MPWKDPEVRRQKLHENYLRRKAEGYKHPVEYERGRRAKLRLFARSLKEGPCVDCGGRFPPECMDFDHVRGEKRYNVAAVSHVSQRVILAEALKCDLVCANCHRVRTHQRRQQDQPENQERAFQARWAGAPKKTQGYHAEVIRA